MKYDCAVIGAGVSGMTSALIMAGKGFRTALVEASPRTAPTIRGFRRRGLFFDTGFHYTGGLNEGEPLDTFFRFLGLSGKIEKYPLDEDGFDTFRCLNPAFEFRFPSGYDRIRRRLGETFPEETGAIDRYLEEVRRIYHSQLYIDLTVSYDAAGAGLAGGQSLREFLDSLTGNEMLKCILSMHCLLHGVTPEEVSFACHACVAGSYYESASGIKGGGLSFSEAFDARLRESGVDVYCGMEVSRILLSDDDRTVRGLRLADGNSLDCEICISTVHPARFLGLVPQAAFRPIYRKRLETLEDTCSAVIVYGECEQVPDSLRRNNILLFPGPRFPDTEEDGPVGEKPFFIAPAPQSSGGSTGEGCIIICPVPNMGSEHRPAGLTGDDRDSYRRYKESMSRDILAHIESSCPEFRGRIKEVECATPLTLKRYTHSPLGSIYGVKHRVDQQNPLPMTRIKNLFLAGQAITAPGILGAVVSGFLACGSLLGHDKLREELQEWA